MSMARTCMHAHMVAHVHMRAHASEDTYTSAHTARTRNIRIRTVDLPLKVRSTGKKQFVRPKFAIRCAKTPGKRCRVTGAWPPIFQRCEVRF